MRFKAYPNAIVSPYYSIRIAHCQYRKSNSNPKIYPVYQIRHTYVMEPIKLNSKLIENASKNKQTPSLMEMLVCYAGEKQ